MQWRAFLLRPETREPDHEKFVKYTESWQRPAQAEPKAQFRQWATNQAQPSGSIPAQVAAKAVDEFAPQFSERFHRRLLEAYFSENRDISDTGVLTDLAGEVGLDRTGFSTHWTTRQSKLSLAVIDEHNTAIDRGITAVPTIVLDNVVPVQGAQDFFAYEHWITRLLARRSQ